MRERIFKMIARNAIVKISFAVKFQHAIQVTEPML